MTTPRNRAHAFFDTHVLRALEEWKKSSTDIYLAMNAAVAINQMADHYWHGFSSDPARVFGTKSAKDFRAELAKRHKHWGLVRDVAEAHKHVKLSRPLRELSSGGQVIVATDGFGGGVPSVLIMLDNGKRAHLSSAVEHCVKTWEQLLA